MKKLSLSAFSLLAGCSWWTSNMPTEEPAPVVETPVSVAVAPPEPERELHVFREASTSPIVTVRVTFDAGSADDYERFEGATFLAARLMAEGGAGQLSYAERERALFPMAAEISFDVDRDQTAFVGRVHRDHLEAFYALFRDMLLRPKYENVDYVRVLEQTKSELLVGLRSTDEEALGKELLQQMIFEGHPYGHATRGTVQSLDNMTLDALRTQRARLFCASHASIGLAGAAPEGFENRVRDDFAALTHPTCGARRGVLQASPVARRVWLVSKPDAASVAISMGMPIEVRRDSSDYPALVLAASYFGQHRQFSGVLMNKMRGDRGLNYGDYAYAENFAQLGWSVYPRTNVSRRSQHFSMWIRPVQPENAHFAIRMAVRELERFVEHGLSQEDFVRIRDYATQYYAFFQQTESQRLGYAIDDRFYGIETPWLERLRTQWQTLTVDEVNAAIRRHVHPENLQIVAIARDAEQLADALASDAPSPITYASEKPEAVLAEDREIQAFPLRIPRSRMHVVPIDSVFTGR